jgi:thiamine kinase
MLWSEAIKLDPSLSSLTDYLSDELAPIHAQTLVGGLTNRCWKVTCVNGHHYVWRPITELTKMFSISRSQEFHILAALQHSSLIIAPKPILLTNQGLLVEWIDGASSCNDVNLMMKLLVNVHQFPVHQLAVIPLSYTGRVDHYWMQLSANYRSHTLAELYHQWREPPVIASFDNVLCHMDIGHYNVIQTDHGNGLIDWEYATLADPRLELALFIDATHQSIPMVIAQYCQLRQRLDLDEWIAGVKVWIPRGRLLALLWNLLAYQYRQEAHYLEEARRLESILCN